LLRETNGLTYVSYLQSQNTETTGEFTIYVELDKRYLMKNPKSKNKQGVFPLIMGMVDDLWEHGVTKAEMDQTHRYLESAQVMNLENTDTNAFHNGVEWLLYNDPEKIVPYDRLYAVQYKSITREQVNAAIKKFFNKDRMYVSCLSGSKQ
jgi:predicted Zn-dependent peptidase